MQSAGEAGCKALTLHFLRLRLNSASFFRRRNVEPWNFAPKFSSEGRIISFARKQILKICRVASLYLRYRYFRVRVPGTVCKSSQDWLLESGSRIWDRGNTFTQTRFQTFFVLFFVDENKKSVPYRNKNTYKYSPKYM